MSSIWRRGGTKLGILIESASDPGAIANRFKLYSKDDGGISQLFGQDSSGVVHQITPATPFLHWGFQTNIAEQFAAGFYDFFVGDNDFDPSIAFGTANVGLGAHILLVTGAANGASVTVEVSGTSISDAGVETAADSEEIVIAAGAADRYFETAKKWNGQVTLETVDGTAITCNFGFAKYYDFRNTDFRIIALEALWSSDSTDSTSNIELLHHKATGWTFNAGAAPSPPTAVADRSIDYSGNLDFRVGSMAWKRTNLNTLVAGGNAEGLLFRMTSGSTGLGALSFREANLELTVQKA